jgi:hypothetical protein
MFNRRWILPSLLATFAVAIGVARGIRPAEAFVLQQPGAKELVVVLKDGREQAFVLADIARIEFRGATQSVTSAAQSLTGTTSLAGNWTAIWEARGLHQGGYRITQSGNKLTFISPDGSTSTGTLKDNVTLVAEQWKSTGTIKNNGKTILWDNGSHWER